MHVREKNIFSSIPLLFTIGGVISAIVSTIIGVTWQISEMKHSLNVNNVMQDARIEALERTHAQESVRNIKFQDYVIDQLEKINDKLSSRR